MHLHPWVAYRPARFLVTIGRLVYLLVAWLRKGCLGGWMDGSPINYILLKHILFFVSQLLFVLFIGTLLQNQTTSKPFQSGNGYITGIFTEEELQPNQADSETLGIRIKRQENPCVNATYVSPMYRQEVVVCNDWSWRCISSIQKGNLPRCNPVYSHVKVTVNGQSNTVRIKTGCTCAYWSKRYQQENDLKEKMFIIVEKNQNPYSRFNFKLSYDYNNDCNKKVVLNL